MKSYMYINGHICSCMDGHIYVYKGHIYSCMDLYGLVYNNLLYMYIYGTIHDHIWYHITSYFAYFITIYVRI